MILHNIQSPSTVLHKISSLSNLTGHNGRYGQKINLIIKWIPGNYRVDTWELQGGYLATAGWIPGNYRVNTWQLQGEYLAG